MKLCKNKELKFWNELDEKYMTEEESDEYDPSVLMQHKPSWRSESNKLNFLYCVIFLIFNMLLELNKFISILDKRDKNQKKKQRILATATLTAIPQNAPTWAVNSPAPAVVPVSDLPNSELVPMITSHVSD